MKRFLTIYLQLCCLAAIVAQETPAPAQTQPIVIMNATAHLGNGEVIEKSIVAFEDGKFTIIGDIAMGRGFDGYEVIDGNGKHLYPGFIAPNTPLGLTEIGAVSSTNDYEELGTFNPNVRSIIAYNTDSDIPPTIRSNGTLLAQIVPQGARLSGSSSVVELDGWNWEDAVYALDNGVHLDWPSQYRRRGFGSSARVEKNDRYDQQVKEVEDFFTAAAAYAKKENPNPVNLKMEAVKGLLDQSKILFVDADYAKSITAAVLFAERHKLKIVIVGGRESWMITDLLSEKKVPVLLGNTQRLPARPDTDIDQPFKTPRMLQEAGVLFGFSMNGSWQQRNLSFQAGQAVGFGLDYEAAVSALTLNTAIILGIGKTVGSIETGKDATFFLCEGDPLDMRGNQLTHAFIRGKAITLDNKQKRLANKFRTKYGH